MIRGTFIDSNFGAGHFLYDQFTAWWWCHTNFCINKIYNEVHVKYNDYKYLHNQYERQAAC